MLDDLVFALDVLKQRLVLVFDSELLFEKLGEFVLNDLLLLSHVLVDLLDAHRDLSIVSFTEFQLFFNLEGVTRAGLDSLDAPFLGLKLSLKGLHIRVVALNLSLEHVLLEAALGDLLLELAVLRDQKLLFTIDFLDLLAVLFGYLFELLVQAFNHGVFSD